MGFAHNQNAKPNENKKQRFETKGEKSFLTELGGWERVIALDYGYEKMVLVVTNILLR